MGTWGTGLTSNDTFADVYGEFMELFNEGQDVKQITSRLLLTNKDLFNSKEDSNNFWFAIAKGQWECNSLDPDVYERVKNIIDSKKDLEVWRELGAEGKAIKQRDKVLEKFLVQLSVEKAKPKSRKKKKVLNPIFEKGDCLIFKLLNGNFGAAVVLEAVYDTPYGFNLVAVTNLNNKSKPTIQEIRDSGILTLNYDSWGSKEQVIWFIPNQFKKDQDKFEVIGKMFVGKTYNTKTDFVSGAGDWFIYIIEVASKQFDIGGTKWFRRDARLKTYL